MMLKQSLIALVLTSSVFLAIAVGAQETPPSAEKKPAEQTTPPAADKPAPPPKAPAAKSTAKDRLDLDSTAITGNRELPKVMYVVPWKKSGMGDLPGRPTNSLLDEVLAPVDRDVFRRQTEYFGALGKNQPKPTSSDTPSQK